MIQKTINSPKYGKQIVFIDNEDENIYNLYKWCLSKRRNKFYIIAINNKKTISLHRILMNPNKDQVVDHINGDPLDNRKENLRICSIQENNRNYPRPKTNTSGYKGVSWNKSKQIWEVWISCNNKNIYMGQFKNKLEAAELYNLKAKELHGSFAKLNEV